MQPKSNSSFALNFKTNDVARKRAERVSVSFTNIKAEVRQNSVLYFLLFPCLTSNLMLNLMRDTLKRRCGMSIDLVEDIRSVTDLKRNTREILEQIHHTGRPVVLTVNGKADAVLIDAKVYEKHLKASNLARLLVKAEEDVAAKRTRPVRSFLKEFKNARKISG